MRGSAFRAAIVTVAAFFVFSSSAFALGKLQGLAEQGGQFVSVSGINSSAKYAKTYPGASVTVYLSGTLTKATLYSDPALTPLANPFSADSGAYWGFFVQDGEYDVQFSGAGIPAPWTITHLRPFSTTTSTSIDVRDYGATCNGIADDGPAFNLAIQAANLLGGVPVISPNAVCAFSTPISLDGTHGVWLLGTNTPRATVPQGAVLVWTGTGAGSAITAFQAAGPRISHLFIYGSNSAFTGTLVNLSGSGGSNSAPVIVEDSIIGASTDLNDTLIKLDNCNSTILHNNFISYGTVQVQGGNTNVVNISDNQFSSYATAAISDPRQNWTINHNNFEPGRFRLAGTLTVTNGSTAVTGSGTTFTANVGGTISITVSGVTQTVNVASVTNDTALTLSSNWSGANSSTATATITVHKMIQDVSHAGNGVSFTNNWGGDSTASNMVTLEMGGNGYHITGNYMSAISGTGNIFAKCTGLCSGFQMSGNVFGTIPQIVVDFNGTVAQSSRGYNISGNAIGSVIATTTVTSVGTTATVTTQGNHQLSTGEFVVISGSANNEYNGRYAITKISATQFSYTFAGSGTSPATGTILVSAPFINQTASNPSITEYTIGPNQYTGVTFSAGAAFTIDRFKVAGPWTNGGQYWCSLSSSVNQATVNTVRLPLLWDTEGVDIGNLHSTTTNTDRITVPSDGGGVWRVCAHVEWAAAAQSGVYPNALNTTIDIFKNATRQTFALQLTTNIGGTTQDVCKDITAVAGDFFQAGATQNSGGGVNVVGGQIDFSWFTAVKLF